MSSVAPTESGSTLRKLTLTISFTIPLRASRAVTEIESKSTLEEHVNLATIQLVVSRSIREVRECMNSGNHPLQLVSVAS